MLLLKWQYQQWQNQPGARDNSWRLTIEERRNQLLRHLRYNPSLKSRLAEAIEDSYRDAILAAARETNRDRNTFPTICPWAFGQKGWCLPIQSWSFGEGCLAVAAPDHQNTQCDINQVKGQWAKFAPHGVEWYRQ